MIAEKEIKYIYSNEKQIRFIEARGFKKRAFIGGRGSGKSTVLGDILYDAITTMPRARGFLAAANGDIIKNFSLPSILERLAELGEIEDIDFVVRKRPPSWFEKPYQSPKDYKNVITFSNGFTLDLLSMYTKSAGRGGNYQIGFFDEAGLIKKETHDKAVLPSVRGCLHKVARLEVDKDFIPEFGKVLQKGGAYVWEAPFRDNPLYRALFYVTSMPWAKSGQWLLDFEEDPEAFFIESTAYDNIEVLGEEYIEGLRQTLPDIVFQVEVMNKRLNQVENGFYSEFSEDRHVITKSLYNPDKEIDISFDFNAGFNSMIIGQAIADLAYVHECLYVKGNLIVIDLVEKFCAAYEDHNLKRVNIYGDRNGNNSYANSKKTIYEEIEEELRRQGWEVFRPEKGLDAPHKEKHEKINTALRESGSSGLPRIRFYLFKCKALIISVSQAEMIEGFKKDKRSERRLSNTDHREEATDLSDCLDNWYMFKFDRFSLFDTSEVEAAIGGF